jgi:hypothetical protein
MHAYMHAYIHVPNENGEKEKIFPKMYGDAAVSLVEDTLQIRME